MNTKEGKNVCSGAHGGDGCTSCAFPFLFITFICLGDTHVSLCTYPSQKITCRNMFSLLPQCSGTKLRPQPQQQAPCLLSHLRDPPVTLVFLSASVRVLPFHPSSSSLMHCLARSSVQPIHSALYFDFCGFRFYDF